MTLNKFKSLAIVVLLVTTACGSKYTTIRQSPDYSQQKVKHSEIIILPTDAVVNTVDFSGSKERMYDYESHVEDLFSQSLTSTLRKNGYTTTSLSKRDIHNKGISGQVLRVKQNYATIRDELYKSNLMPEEQALSTSQNIGKPELNLKSGSKPTLLLLSDYVADVKTSGARTKDVLVDALIGSRTASSADVGRFVVGIVDANNGALLWSNTSTDAKDAYIGAFERVHSSDHEIDKKRVNRLTENALNNLIQEKE